MLGDFKKFITRGNVLDMAVGIIIGAAFTTIVQSLVADVIMPPIGLIMGNVDFSNLYLNISGTPYASLADAKAAGAATINYGVFLNNVVTFLIVAFATFMLIRVVSRLQRKEEVAVAPTEKVCPQCLFKIPVAARRCGHCTQELSGAVI